MLFMGEEWGASTPWQYFTDHPDPELAEAVRQGRRDEFAGHGWDREQVPDPQDESTVAASRLDWSEPGRGPHARLLAWYRDLIRLRHDRADLHDPRLDRVEVVHDEAARTVLVRRGEHRVAVNLGTDVAELDVETPGTELLLAWEPGTTVAGAGRGAVVVLAPRSAAVLGPA
jgi:maltooligosyltrehalose trehalohydrolase